jgi:hypothetical protein
MGYCFVIYRRCAIFQKPESELRLSEPPRIEKLGGTFFSFFPLQAFEISQNGERNPWKNLDSDRSRPGEEEGHVTGNLS